VSVIGGVSLPDVAVDVYGDVPGLRGLWYTLSLSLEIILATAISRADRVAGSPGDGSLASG
jgi:hypothetical protein